ncbi:hypothetical protein AUP07_1518 [methanogenic archaeon mixed culture ISO4-G1]|nr:hypothetical protein AUP07_1518 [methanogenic archaeon mixed culture ISO4-G1]
MFYFVLRFAQMNGIDLYDSLAEKIAKNNEKYPAVSRRTATRSITNSEPTFNMKKYGARPDR